MQATSIHTLMSSTILLVVWSANGDATVVLDLIDKESISGESSGRASL